MTKEKHITASLHHCQTGLFFKMHANSKGKKKKKHLNMNKPIWNI